MITLFAFPYAFGGANIYTKIEKYLDKEIKLLPINYPGHESEWMRNPCNTIQGIAEDVYRKISENLDEDYALLGYSMGGIVCYELYQLLHKNNKKLPKYIFLFGANEPDFKQEQQDYENFTTEQIRDKLIKLDGTSIEVLYNDELMEFLKPIITSDLTALANYEPTSCSNVKLVCPVVVVRGSEEEDTENCEIGWNKYIENSCEYLVVEGNHFFLFDKDEKKVASYVSIINSRIRNVVCNSLV
ncbi:thioesterase II family protein [Bacillus mycoides]|uniref:thioesterase II family protein n=1 Tax=Bacillus mycoides TaxID=1405 RepID=UPI000A27D8C1|nr:thioesterase domain-containing protein [Bacillus mycoides]OSX93766.1 hypothetical protein BTJ44_01033 [Bacillus mycoides]